MWHVYDKKTKLLQKVCKSRKSALAWRTRKHNEFLRKEANFVTNQGPMFDFGCAESIYFETVIKKSLWST